MNRVDSSMDLTSTQRVLIYRLGSLGDMVVALPALHLIKQSFPRARRLLLTNHPVHAKAPAASEVLGNSGLVDGFISYPVGARSVMPLAKLWWQIIRFRPQVLIYLAASRGDDHIKRDARFFHLCGVAKIIGLHLGPSAASTYFPETELWEHEAARLSRMVEALGKCDVDDRRNWDLGLTEEEKGKARNALSHLGGTPFVVCGAGTKMQAKDWGRENWRQLLSRLSAEMPDHALAMVGAKEEAELSDYAASQWRGPFVNLCGRLSVRESAAVISNAELFMGPDSGPMHLAAAVGVPCACVFAARDKPGAWYPRGPANRVIYHRVDCMQCYLETCVAQKKRCLTSITVDEMFAAAVDAWEHGKKAVASGPA